MKFQRLIIVTILTERLPPSVSCGPNLHYTTEFEAFINEEQEAKQRSYRISMSSLRLVLRSNRGVDIQNICPSKIPNGGESLRYIYRVYKYTLNQIVVLYLRGPESFLLQQYKTVSGGRFVRYKDLKPSIIQLGCSARRTDA